MASKITALKRDFYIMSENKKTVDEKEEGIRMRVILALFAHGAWAGTFIVLFSADDLSHGMEGHLNQLIGALTAIILMIYGFYFASSNGSKIKQQNQQDQILFEMDTRKKEPDVVIGADHEVHADSPLVYPDKISQIEQGVYKND